MLFKFMVMKMTFVMMKIMIFQIWTPPNQLGVNFEKAESGKFANLLLCTRYGWKIGRNRKNPTLCLFLWWHIIFFNFPFLDCLQTSKKYYEKYWLFFFHFSKLVSLGTILQSWNNILSISVKIAKENSGSFQMQIRRPPPTHTHTDIPTVIVKTSNKLWNQMKMKMKQRRSWN